MSRFIVFVLITLFFITVSCKKENGLFFLRVMPPTDTIISGLEVFDASGAVVVDGKYYPVSQRLEISYVLYDVVRYQIKDWNSTMIYNEFTYDDENIHEYLGEFEKDESDKYYTLIIDFNKERRDEPIYNQWADYYFYSFSYNDKSVVTFSYNKEE